MADNMKVDTLENGTVNISDDVIGIITSIAVTEVEGVHGFHGGFAKDLAEKFGMKSHKKGVEVRVEENDVFVVLHLIVDYGANISEIAMNVQSKVKMAVENMTDLTVKTVDVFIDAINIPNKKVKDVEVSVDMESDMEETTEELVVEEMDTPLEEVDLNEDVVEEDKKFDIAEADAVR